MTTMRSLFHIYEGFWGNTTKYLKNTNRSIYNSQFLTPLFYFQEKAEMQHYFNSRI